MPVTPPSAQPITPWITAGDLARCNTVTGCNGCDPNATAPTPPVQTWTDAELVQAATDLLYKASGYRFPGVMTETVMIRSDDCGCTGTCHHYPFLETDQQWPILSITEVKIGGTVVDSTTYALDDWSRLVRLADPVTHRNPGWPVTTLRLDKTPADTADTMTVTYTYGRPVPQMGKIAALALACGMRTWTGPVANLFGANVVPGRAATKKDASQAFLDGQTGIVEVDRFLAPEPHGYGVPKPSFIGVWTPGLEATAPVRRSWP